MKIPAFQMITNLDELVETFGDTGGKLAAFLTQQREFAHQINAKLAELNELGDLETQRSQAAALMAEAQQHRALAQTERAQAAEATQAVDALRQQTEHALAAREVEVDAQARTLATREEELHLALARARALEDAAEQAQLAADQARQMAEGRGRDYDTKLDEVQRTLAGLARR